MGDTTFELNTVKNWLESANKSLGGSFDKLPKGLQGADYALDNYVDRGFYTISYKQQLEELLEISPAFADTPEYKALSTSLAAMEQTARDMLDARTLYSPDAVREAGNKVIAATNNLLVVVDKAIESTQQVTIPKPLIGVGADDFSTLIVNGRGVEINNKDKCLVVWAGERSATYILKGTPDELNAALTTAKTWQQQARTENRVLNLLNGFDEDGDGKIEAESVDAALKKLEKALESGALLASVGADEVELPKINLSTRKEHCRTIIGK